MNRVSRLILPVFILMLIAAVFTGCLHSAPPPTIPFDMDFEEEYSPLELRIDDYMDEFRILQLADTQLRHPDPYYVREKFGFVERVINEADPDLIVFTGDNTEGPRGKAMLEELIPFMDDFNIPYAAVFGNHDQEGGSRSTLADYYINGKNSLFKKGPSNIHGVGNYQINLIQDDSVKYSFFMIDSNTYRTYSPSQKRSSEWGGRGYDYIYPDQIAWYAWSVNETTAANNRVIPSLAFFHIAIPEYRAYEEAAPEDIIIPQSKGGEPVCNAYVNTGMFRVMKELGSTRGMFVGHDHINNYVFKYQDIILGYGLKTGKTSYFDEELQGGTLITLKNDFEDIEIEHIYVLDED